MQRMAAKLVRKLKHLQVTKKGSGLARTLVLEEEEALGGPSSSSPFPGIFFLWISQKKQNPSKRFAKQIFSHIFLSFLSWKTVKLILERRYENSRWWLKRGLTIKRFRLQNGIPNLQFKARALNSKVTRGGYIIGCTNKKKVLFLDKLIIWSLICRIITR